MPRRRQACRGAAHAGDEGGTGESGAGGGQAFGPESMPHGRQSVCLPGRPRRGIARGALHTGLQPAGRPPPAAGSGIMAR
jgi:hypothetical protein